MKITLWTDEKGLFSFKGKSYDSGLKKKCTVQIEIGDNNSVIAAGKELKAIELGKSDQGKDAAATGKKNGKNAQQSAAENSGDEGAANASKAETGDSNEQ